jgi:sulfopyruvate decarboxylase TPP-binding subunit
MNAHPYNIPASAYLAALQRNGVDHFVTVPDWIQLALHERVEAGVDGLELVRCSNEDQAVCVSAGLRIAGKRPITVIQNQGLYACVNALRAICLDASIPVVFLVGHFGREFDNFGQDPNLSERNTVKLLEPVLSALGVRSWRLETERDLAGIDEAFSYADKERRSAVLIVGAPTGWN